MSWYLCRTVTNSELVAKMNLENQGYMVYCPMSFVDKRTGKKRDIEPLFCGYIFVQLQPGRDNFHPIRSTRGVLNLVRFGLWPAEVPDSLIADLQRHEDEQGIHHIPQHDYLPGDRVRVRNGMLGDYLAIVQETRKDRIYVLIEVANRRVHAELTHRDLEPVKKDVAHA